LFLLFSIFSQSLNAHHNSVDLYGGFVRGLAFEKRARPTNRTGTEEFLLEEKETERLERAKRKRMLGLDESSE